MLALAFTVSLLFAGSPASADGAYGHVDFAKLWRSRGPSRLPHGNGVTSRLRIPAAAEAFRRAEAADPGFAMAYWGRQ